MRSSSTLIRAAIHALALFGLGSAFAQTAAPAPASTAASTVKKLDDDTVVLSPFTVTSDQDQGYVAANTLAGSRLNTSLRDTAASISVLTDELIQEVGAIDLTEAIAFGNNVELELPDGNARLEFFNTFMIRGQAAQVARNYFRWKLPTNTYNVERIEEARGPNSILFGVASAGGLLSQSTKQAVTGRNFNRARFTYGSYDLRNASVDVNRTSFNGKLAVRFNGLLSETQGYQHYLYNEDYRGHVAVKYDLRPNTIVRAEYEKGQTHQIAADNQEIGDNVLKWIEAGRAVLSTTTANGALGILKNGTGGNLGVTFVEDGVGSGFFSDLRGMLGTQNASAALVTVRAPELIDPVNFKISTGGPNQSKDSTFETYSASIEQKLGKHTFLQLAFNHQEYEFSAWQAAQNSGSMRGDPNKFLKDGVTPNPHAGGIYFDTTWVNRRRAEELDNLRFMGSTEFDLGKWGDYRFAMLAEREESNWSKDNFNEIWVDAATGLPAFNALANNSANFVKRRHYVTEGDQSTYFASFGHPGVAGFFGDIADPSKPGRKLNSALRRASGTDFDDPQEQDSVLLAMQAFYFDRKLVVAGGYRQDRLYIHEGQRGTSSQFVSPSGEFFYDNDLFPRDNRKASGSTRTYGVVYHALPWISLRYNNSNSFELPPAIRIVPPPDANGHFIGSVLADSPHGRGEDYGFDLNLFDGRIFIRATRFETIRDNAVRNSGPNGIGYNGTLTGPTVLKDLVINALLASGQINQAEADLHAVENGGATFDVISKGYEFSVTANITKNWRMRANYSITDPSEDNIAPEVQAWAAAELPYFRGYDTSVLTTQGKTIEQTIQEWESANATILSVEGINAINSRRHKFSANTNYKFDEGFLKGFSFGGNVIHQSKMVVGAKENSELVYGSSFTTVGAHLRYDFRRRGKSFFKTASIQLNVLNLLNDHDPLITRYADVDAATLLVNRLVPQDPISWRLTASLSF